MTKHLMLDYIREQPEAVANTLSACEGPVNELRDRMARRPPKNIIFAGLGSSHTAAKLASPLLRHFLPVPTTITVATEVGLDLGLELGPDTLVVLTSRSGSEVASSTLSPPPGTRGRPALRSPPSGRASSPRAVTW